MWEKNRCCYFQSAPHISLNGISSVSMSKYTNISVKMSFKENPSAGRKISVSMIASISKYKYLYKFEHESEWDSDGTNCSLKWCSSVIHVHQNEVVPWTSSFSSVVQFFQSTKKNGWMVELG